MNSFNFDDDFETFKTPPAKVKQEQPLTGKDGFESALHTEPDPPPIPIN